jgi:hypothetical protein
MTVQQLRDVLDKYCPDPDEEFPLSLVIDDLSYVVSALLMALAGSPQSRSPKFLRWGRVGEGQVSRAA